MKKNKFKILSGSALKMIAVVTMLIDHLGVYLIYKFDFAKEALVNVGSKDITLYYIMRLIGRIAFPIFCFLLVEGFVHTRNRKKYGINLLIFAIVSEVPWNLVHTNSWRYERQNVFFTLLLGYLGLCLVEKFKDQYGKQAIGLIALYIVAKFLKSDYGLSGYALILIIYSLRDSKVIQAIAGSCVLSSGWKAGIAFIPINMYNGKRGFIKGKVWKYAFYAFYPVHILTLYVIRNILF